MHQLHEVCASAGLVVVESDPAPVLWFGAAALLLALALLALSGRRA